MSSSALRALGLDARVSQHRLLHIVAPSPEDGVYPRQRRLLEGGEEGFVERDLLPGELFETGSCGGEQTLSREAAARERFRTEAGQLVAVLAGKGGGTVDHCSHSPVESGGIRSRRRILYVKEGDAGEGRPGLLLRSDVTFSGIVRILAFGWIASHGVPGAGCQKEFLV